MAPATFQSGTDTEAYERARQTALDARDLLAAIESRGWPAETLLLRGARIARNIRADRVEQWIDWEMRGYNPADPDALDLLDQTLRRAAEDTAHARCDGLPVIEARMVSLREEERRLPDPREAAIRFDDIRREIARLTAVRSAVLALLHAFASHVFADRMHLLDPDERRLPVAALVIEPQAFALDEPDDPVDVAGCLEALDAFIDGIEEPPPSEHETLDGLPEPGHPDEVVLDEEEDADILVEDAAEEADYAQEAEPAPDPVEATIDATAPEAGDEEPMAVAVMDEDAVDEPDAGEAEETDWDAAAEIAAPPRYAESAADILLTDADIDAIFAATEDDIADFDGDDPGKETASETRPAERKPEPPGEEGSEGVRNEMNGDPFARVDSAARAEVERFVMGADPNAVGSIKAAEISLHNRMPGAAPQALRAQRHLIETVADRVMPPSPDTLEIDRYVIANEPAKPFNRLFAWLRLRIADADGARPLRYALFHHYRRLDPDFYRQADAEEAEALIDRTFALLYRTLTAAPANGPAQFAG